jgi:amino acid adenylation domain-containing protein/FkbH-like protein
LDDLKQTVAELSPAKRALLEKLRGKTVAGASQAPPLRRRGYADDGGKYRLSFAQQRLWLIQQLNPKSSAYNVPRAVRVRGKLDVDLLAQALRQVIARHEVLRARFEVEGDEPVQIIPPSLDIPLPVQDLSSLPATEREREALRLVLENYRRAFDLARDPVLRVRLFRLDAEDHLLLVVMHHIASDGWTGGLLFEELGFEYAALREGQAVNLPALPVQYSDYAAWQRDWMQGETLAREISFWRKQLEGAPPIIDLPTDYPRAAAPQSNGSKRTLLLPAAATDQLKSLSQRHGMTLFPTLLAGLDILLSRWSAQQDLVVGTISANRNQTEIERMIGCFMNFLPLRVRVTPGALGTDLLAQAKQAVLDAFAHQDCPFEKVVEALNPERTLSPNPLFNVGLLLQNYPEFAFRGAGLEARFLELDTNVAFLDLRFVVTDTANGLELVCEFNTELFSGETAELLVTAYGSLLEQLALRPEMHVEDYALPPGLLAQAAREKESKATIAVAATFTAEPVEEPLAFCMEQLGTPAEIAFAGYGQIFQELLNPDGLLGRNHDGCNLLLIRVEDWKGDGALSDSETQAKIGCNVADLVQALRAAASRSTVPQVVICCPASDVAVDSPTFCRNMEELLMSQLAGVAGVTVITSEQLLRMYPVAEYRDAYADKVGSVPYTAEFFAALAAMAARRIFALRSAPSKVIVLDCDNTLWQGVCGEEGPLGVTVDAPRHALQQFMREQHDAGMLLCLASKNSEEDVFAVFEKNPGMVLLREHIVASQIHWNAKSKGLHALAAQLQLGLDSFIFVDDNPLECAEVRANCPQVVVLELPTDPASIPNFLRNVWAFDHWTVTEEDRQRGAMYRENVERETLRTDAPDLDTFLASLDLKIAISPMQPEDLARVAQLTERTNQFNCTTIRRKESEIERLRRDGAEVLVVRVQDRFGDYGLVGVALFATNANALRVDTLLLSCRALGRRVEHNILARLGMIAREHGLGFVEIPFLATEKNQPALDFLEGLRTASREERPDGFMFRVTAADAVTTPSEKLLIAPHTTDAEKLPSTHPVSNDFTKRAQILNRIARELTSARRIEQAAGSSKNKRARGHQPFLAPRNPVEEVLASLWSRLLRVERVGIHDNFFQLGGHSLMATQLVARIRRSLGVELPLRAVFEAPTIAGLGELVVNAQRERAGLQMPPLLPVPRTSDIPLSFAQQRLWFLDQLEPGSPLYNIPQVFRMQGALHVDAIERALAEIVRRHEALRTTFPLRNGRPVQQIAPELRIPLARIDLSQLPEENREEQAEQCAREEATRSFDLARGPLLRATLVHLGQDDHLLAIVMHHVISDRWSMGLMTDELTALYAAFVEERPSPLRDLGAQYADFAVWQRHWLEGELLEKQLSYWKHQLEGAPAVLDLPTDRPRPAVQTYRGSTQRILLSEELTAQLRAFSQNQGSTLFMTLLAGFQALLSRYSGQDDIVVGSPIANRNHADIEPLIGFFVNTLAFRADLSGDPSLRELLTRVKEAALGAYCHQDIPFEKLVEELQPERSLSHNPVFQVMFALQNAPLNALELPGLHLERVPVYTQTSLFDMAWFAIEVPEGLLLRAEYNTDLFDASTIQRMLRHFETLLEGALADPERRLSEVSLLDGEERRRILVEFNATGTDYPSGLCIHDFLEQRAALTPDAIALVCDTQRITYRELNSRANQIAHYLVKHGAGPNVLVGIYSHRSADMVAGILGVLKSGSAYVPLDPNYPKERIGFILEDANAQVVLTEKALLGDLPTCGARFICLDSDWGEISRESTANLGCRAEPSNLAYVLFTSGSTGRPKGVAIEHRNTVLFIQWCHETFGEEELAGVLFCTSICFDMSTFEMFCTIGAGGKIILAQDPLAWPSLPAREEVTCLNTVPSAIAELVRMKAVPKTLKTVALAGEALPESLVEDIYASAAVEKVYNLYGPTENGYSTSTLVRRGAAVTIGKPLANEQAYVLDADRTPVPIGVPGEIYLAGEGLARGYYGRPGLTTERFLPNPFGAAGARMYRTGDLGRWLADGNLQYLGRIDHQVKIRGFRIELGDIEAALARHPGVRQTVVMAREDAPGDKRLVGYVVADVEPAPDAEQLRQHLKQSLPEFMIPAAFVILDAFPLTPNGKVNRKALPEPEYTRQESAAFVGPSTPTEAKIAAIWAEVLHVAQIGAHDDFFRLGGHSLLAAQVVSRLRQAFEVELPLRTLFEAPTVAALAERIDGAQRGLEQLLLRPVPRGVALPPSFAQQRLWFLDQLDPGNALYNIPCQLHVASALNLKALEASLDLLAARHETLRTTFNAVDGQPVQVIAPSVRIPLQLVDVSQPELAHLLSDARKQEAQRLIDEEARLPFDLGKGPLLRALVVRLSPEEHILLLTIHHIISDRWSMGVLLSELATLYEACCEGEPSPLPALPVQYADFAVWQRQYLQGEVFEQQLAFWKDHLAGAPAVIELPTDRPRPPFETFRGDVANVCFSKDLAAKLNTLSHDQGTTLFMTLLAAFNVLLSRYSGQDDIVLGLPIASRNHPQTEGLIGFFSNTLPLRTRLTGDSTFTALLSSTKEASLAAYAHQDLPFEKLVEELSPERNLSHSPLVQVFFILQNAPLEGLRLQGLPLEHVETQTKTSKGDMFVSLAEKEDGLHARVEFSTDLFEAATIERLLEHFRVLLESIVVNPDRRITELSILSTQEREQIVVTWNNTHQDYPRERSLHQFIEDQVERTPDAPALVFESEQLTYRQLDARANQLAHRLRKLGVGPDVLVGICAERSLEMVVGLLGIMKAGGAYVPIDPDYPRERLAVMLEDASPPVVLTLERLLDVLPQHGIPAFCLDRDWHTLAHEPTTAPEVTTNGKNLAYAIYTSGSTGKPKGVPNVHEGIVNRLLWMQHAYPIAAKDRVLQKTPYSFDVSVWEFFWPLMTGACLVVARPGGHKDPSYLVDFIVKHNITTLHFVPSMLRIFLETEGVRRCTSLRQVFCSGEALPLDLQERFFELLSPELHNLYGPTEAAVDVTYWHCASNSGRSSVPIGKPIWNTQIYILDKRLQPVPVGVAGELHIGGVGLARGYLKRPELTAEKFIADPFSRDMGARLYKTGDSARFLPDGNIEYLGRIDHQVKLRGFRIELGEIETALSKHPGVRQSTVLVREDSPGDQRLVAYVILDQGVAPDAEQLRQHLGQSLPEFMIPAAFVALDAFPLTSSGKTDRKALPKPEYESRESTRWIAPRTPVEEGIAAIWREVLHLQQVGARDDFFALGGHSLLATQVIARIRQIFRVEMPLRSLFETPTIQGLAGIVEDWQRGQQGWVLPPLTRTTLPRPLPLSFAQQRLWFQDQLEPNTSLYNIPLIARLKGPLSTDALEFGLNEIVRRHEALRTTFHVEHDEPVQVVGPVLPFAVPTRDVTHLPEAERLTETRRLALEEVRRPFDLARGPLLRPSLFKLGDEDHALILNMHHVISDRWSMGVLSQELAALYEAHLAGKPSPLPELAVQYGDYAVWQRGWLQGDVLETQMKYWRQHLDGAPPVLKLPTDRPRAAKETFWGNALFSPLPEDLSRELRVLGRKEGVTFFMTLLAAFQSLLARQAGTDDIVVGTDLANRTAFETERLIGFFVNLLPVRTRLAGDPTFRELLRRVKESALGALSHQDVPFEKLVEELQPERSKEHNPLVQVLFVMQNTPQPVKEFGGLTSGPLGVVGASRFDLVLFINDPDGAPSAMWMFNPNLFDASTIERWARQYEILLRAGLTDPEIRLSGLGNLLAGLEREERAAAEKEFQEASQGKLKKFKRKTMREV